jgi:hypothetical protein
MTYLFYCFKVFVFVFVFAGLVVEILFKCGPVPLGLSPHLKYFGQRPAWWKKAQKILFLCDHVCLIAGLWRANPES